MAGRHAWRGVCVAGGMCGVGGCAWWRGMHGGGGAGMHGGGVHGRGACMVGWGECVACMPPQQILRDTVMWSMRGWYASYWNAFLLSYVFIVFSLFSITLLCTAFKSFRCIVTGPPGTLLFDVKPEIALK